MPIPAEIIEYLTAGAKGATKMVPGVGTVPKVARVPPEEATPEDYAGLDAALAADRKEAEDNVFASNMSRAASLYRGAKNVPSIASPVPTDMRDWMLKRGLRAEDAAARAQADVVARARAEQDFQNAPAPEEWEAPAGMRRSEASKWLGTKKDGKPEDPLLGLKGEKLQAEVDNLREGKEHKKPPTSEQIARGKVLGVLPAEDEDSIHYEAAIRAAANANRTAGQKEDARGDKKKASRYLGPDFEFGEEVPSQSVPDTTRAKLMDEAGLVNHVHDSAQELRNLLKKHGPSVVGKAATQMKTLVEDLRLTVKDPVYNLGVLNGRDYELVSRIISDPTSMGQILSSEAGVRDLDTALSTAQRQWKAKIRQRMRGYGASPVKGGKYDEGKETIRVRRKADGKEGSMPAGNFNPDVYEKIG